MPAKLMVLSSQVQLIPLGPDELVYREGDHNSDKFAAHCEQRIHLMMLSLSSIRLPSRAFYTSGISFHRLNSTANNLAILCIIMTSRLKLCVHI
jgi:hypothetical protein